MGLFQETVEDTSSEIPAIAALLRINKYDLDQTVTNELDFILGAVFSQSCVSTFNSHWAVLSVFGRGLFFASSSVCLWPIKNEFTTLKQNTDDNNKSSVLYIFKF